MRTIEATQKINVEGLLAHLRQMRITPARFKIALTPEQCYDALSTTYKFEVERRHRNFRFDAYIQTLIRSVSAWLCDTERSNFGMLFCGGTGNGKTTMACAIRSLHDIMSEGDAPSERKRFVFVDATTVNALAKRDYDKYRTLYTAPLLLIDDLGQEPAEVLDYGNAINPTIDLLTHRYNEQLFTVITTNLAPRQIREKYGDRLADRFNEMFTKFVFQGETYRL